MTIDDIRVNLNEKESPIQAYCSFCIDGAFVIHDVRVIQYSDGLHVVMPSRHRNGKYIDIAHPTSKEIRDDIQEKVIAAYEEAKKAQANHAPAEEIAEA